MDVLSVALLTAAVIIFSVVVGVLHEVISWYWMTPRRIRMIMERQGVRGPKNRPLVGNIPEMASMVAKSTSIEMDTISHDIVDRLLPHYVAWSAQYGRRFIYWNGVEPRLCLMETDLIRELLCKHSTVTGKSWLQREGAKPFIGLGLLMANGEDWHRQRRLVAPAFTGEQVKRYEADMVRCTENMLGMLKDVLDSGKNEVEISEYMTLVTADIIAQTEFGSSYEKGKMIFCLLKDLQKFCAQATRHLCIPGSRFFPNKYNRDIKALKIQVEQLLMEIVQSRTDRVNIGRSSSYGNDLLGILLNEMEKSQSFDLQLIMDECKTFFFAGHETTALLLTWTVMLLACNSDWQEKIRAELAAVCHGGTPTADHLSRLSLLTMVINESLRLYPSATVMPRTAFKDFKLGDLLIPRGLSIWIPVLALNHSVDLWGADANEFKPERFSTKSFAANRQFIPFAAGPRNCVGQSFAMMEVKLIIAMFVSRFRFTISKNYRHAPVVILTILPKYGVQIRLEPLH